MINLTGQSLGRYHIIESLGEGGMASVYKAYDTNLERNVAIKVIRTDKGLDPEFLGRFQREAKALAQLDHPYIVKVLDFGEQDGMPYLVMPFLPGGTLKQKMGSPTHFLEAAKLLAPIARALEYAHNQGIIHRDVKPANILITQGGAPMLSDFGLAKMLERKEETQLTRSGVGMGTPDYMAPEQWTGQGDYRSDIYALGIVLYEMVIGRKPYIADTPAAVLIKHVNDPLPRPKLFVPGIPDEVEQVIIKSLAKKPGDRYQNMGLFADTLEKMSQGILVKTDNQGQFTSAQPRSPGSHQAEVANRKLSPACLGIAAGALVLGMIFIGIIALFAIPAVIRGGNIATTVPAKISSTNSDIRTATVSNTTSEKQPTIMTPTPAARITIPSQTVKTSIPTPITNIEGLPADVPFLKENNGDLTTTTNNDVDMYMYTSIMDGDQALEFFKTEMKSKGWTLANTMTSKTADTNSTTLQYQKSSRMVMISVTRLVKQNMIQVVTMLLKKT